MNAEVVEWQTRWTQNPLLETTCGFKSHLRHQETFNPKGLEVFLFITYLIANRKEYYIITFTNCNIILLI